MHGKQQRTRSSLGAISGELAEARGDEATVVAGRVAGGILLGAPVRASCRP
jgi:hypothetical protein